MLTKEQKKQVVEHVRERIGVSKSVVFIDYKGLTVAEFGEMKKTLRQEGSELRVVKKRLLERAGQEAGVRVNAKDLDGQVAVAFSLQDEVGAAKIIQTFAKKNEKIKMLGGILEGAQISADSVQALAKLPGRQELLAQVVGTMNAPLSSFVRVLSGNIRGFVQVLKAVSEK